MFTDSCATKNYFYQENLLSFQHESLSFQQWTMAEYKREKETFSVPFSS